MKFAMPTSTPTFWAEDSVSIGTSRSKLRVSHQTPLRLWSVVEVLRVRPWRAFLWIGSEFDRDVEGIPFVQGGNAKPVVERRVL